MGYRRVAFSLFAALVASGCDCFSPLAPGAETGIDGSPTRPITLVVTGQTSLLVGTSTPLTATATFPDGSQRNVTGSSTWASSDGNICAMTSGGQTTGMAPGNCLASASFQQVSAVLPLTVSGVPEGGRTTPTPPSDSGTLFITGAQSLGVGESTQWDAWYTRDGIQSRVTQSSTWASDRPDVASVNSAGLVTGVAENVATIRASYLGLAASAPVQVNAAGTSAPTIVSLSIIGTPCHTVGSSAQLQAMAQLSNGATQNVTTTAAWSSDQNSIATVTAGLVSCHRVGTTTIHAGYSGHSASVVVTISGGNQPPVLIGIEVAIEANVVGGGSPLNLNLSTLLSDPLLDVRVYALYSDSTRQEVTSASVITTDNPLLVVNGPGVLNAAGVLAQALVDPDHVVNTQYGGFTVLASVHINTPLLETLPISSLQLPSLATLTVGTRLPNVTAILSNGFGGTTTLIVPAATAGLVFRVTPRNYVPILGPIAGATVNAVLTAIGDLVGNVIVISNGAVQSINIAPLGGAISLLGGVLQVDTRAVVGGITSNSVPSVIPL